MSIKIRKCDEGTEFAAALRSGAKVGMSHATDAEVMAGFCNDTIQLLVGAVSGRLVWEGAQARGMSSKDLLKVVHARDLDTLDDLQFGEYKPTARVTA